MQKLPNSVMAYWCSDNLVRAFSEYMQVRDAFSLECGIKNGSNEKFLRAWFEVSDTKTNKSQNRDDCMNNMKSGKKWFRCNKGGGYKKWYGNYEYVVDLEHNATNIRTLISPSTYRLRNVDNYFGKLLHGHYLEGISSDVDICEQIHFRMLMPILLFLKRRKNIA